MTGYILCHTEHVWHPYAMKQRKVEKQAEVTGTHGGVIGKKGVRLDEELAARRRAKNARNAARTGQERKPGSQKRVLGRLFTEGNRTRRGLGS